MQNETFIKYIICNVCTYISKTRLIDKTAIQWYTKYFDDNIHV